MERNEIVGNAVARTDRSALIKATRASDFPQNQSGDCFRGPRGFGYSHQNIALQVLSGTPRVRIHAEGSDSPRGLYRKAVQR